MRCVGGLVLLGAVPVAPPSSASSERLAGRSLARLLLLLLTGLGGWVMALRQCLAACPGRAHVWHMVGWSQGSGCVCTWLFGTGVQQLVHCPCFTRLTCSASFTTSTVMGMGAVGIEAVPPPHDAGT